MGASSNLFHQGFAKEADDAKVIASAMAKPGIVLRRAVGTDDPFGEDARLPTNLDMKQRGASIKAHKSPGKKAVAEIDDKTARKAALAYEKEQQERDRARRKEQAELDKRREKRERATARAQAVLNAAEEDHEAKVAVSRKSALKSMSALKPKTTAGPRYRNV